MQGKNLFFIPVLLLLSFFLFNIYSNFNLTFSPSKPNIVLISIDAVRADHLTCYGYHRNTTPNICEVAKDGVLFENAYAQGGCTYISLPSLYSSVFPYCHSINSWLGKLDREPQIFKIFEKEGYKTKFITNFVPKEGWKRLNLNATKVESSPKIIQELEGLSKGSSPFLSVIHYNGAHAPYFKINQNITFFNQNLTVNRTLAYKLQSPTLRDRIKRTLLNNLSSSRKEKMIRFITNRYDGKIRKTDLFIGGVIEFLKRKNIYKDSVVVITADHGEYLGERGRYFTHNGVYEPIIHVPLVIKFPSSKYSGERISQIVRHVDVLPTLTDLFNLEDHAGFQGESLLPLFQGRHLDLISYSNFRGRHAIRTGKYKYIYRDLEEEVDINFKMAQKMLHKNQGAQNFFKKYDYNESKIKNVFRQKYKKWWRVRSLNKTELYNLSASSGEARNIAQKYPKIAESLKGKLFKMMSNCPEKPGNVNESLSQELLKKLEKLGYLRYEAG